MDRIRYDNQIDSILSKYYCWIDYISHATKWKPEHCHRNQITNRILAWFYGKCCIPKDLSHSTEATQCLSWQIRFYDMQSAEKL